MRECVCVCVYVCMYVCEVEERHFGTQLGGERIKASSDDPHLEVSFLDHVDDGNRALMGSSLTDLLQSERDARNHDDGQNVHHRQEHAAAG